jgi:hypothetical protein
MEDVRRLLAADNEEIRGTLDEPARENALWMIASALEAGEPLCRVVRR